ncbi:hypothetical protein JKP88DRAFT_264289 [Tribonema minus]|uniref:Uncharacterized protein n=1 Tax=Tribonema minus TaxID=303371 RepID=A0A835YQ18_9STRA|nr:hypothetical protein JKP88DRAFT_264289 [Tribonema minus]
MQEVVRAAVQALADGLAAQQSQAAQLHHMVGALRRQTSPLTRTTTPPAACYETACRARRQAAGKADRPDAERALALSGAAQTEAAALRAELAGLRGEVLAGLADLRGSAQRRRDGRPQRRGGVGARAGAKRRRARWRAPAERSRGSRRVRCVLCGGAPHSLDATALKKELVLSRVSCINLRQLRGQKQLADGRGGALRGRRMRARGREAHTLSMSSVLKFKRILLHMRLCCLYAKHPHALRCLYTTLPSADELSTAARALATAKEVNDACEGTMRRRPASPCAARSARGVVAELRSQVQSVAARGGLQESQRWQANSARLKALEEASAALQRRVDACEAQGLLLDAPDVRRRIDSLEAQQLPFTHFVPLPLPARYHILNVHAAVCASAAPQLAGKADAATLETALAAKANRASVAAALHRKANKEEVRPALEAALRRRADADGAAARMSEAVAEVAARMEELEANALNELIARVEDLEGAAQQNKSIVEDIVGQLNDGGARPLTPYAGSAQHHSSSSAQALHSSTAAAAAAAAAAAELEEDVAAARQAAAAAHAAAQAVEAQLVDLGDEQHNALLRVADAPHCFRTGATQVVARLDALERAAAASRDQLQDQLQHASQGCHRPPSDAGAPSAHPAWGSPLSPTMARAGSRGDDGDGPELRSADALSTAGTAATVARAVAEELERGGWDEQMGWVEGQIEGHEARIAAVEGGLGSLQQQHAYLLAAVQSATTAAAAAAATANAAAPPPSPFLQRHYNAPTSTLAQSAQTAAPAPPPQGSGAFVTDGQSGWGSARVFSPTTSAGADSPFAAAVDAASSPSDSGHGGGGGGDVSGASPPSRHGGAERGAPGDAPPATPPPPPRRRAARPLPAQGETTGGRGVSMQVYRGSPAPQESAASSSLDSYDSPQDLAVAGAGPRQVDGATSSWHSADIQSAVRAVRRLRGGGARRRCERSRVRRDAPRSSRCVLPLR